MWFWWLVTQTCKEKGCVVAREADSVRGWLNAHSCQCELWRLTSGGAQELRRWMSVRRIDSRDVCAVFSQDWKNRLWFRQRREGQRFTLTKQSLDVDVKTPCRRSCSYGSRRQRVASLGLSSVVSGRVSKAWWQIRLGVWHSQYRSIVTSGSLAPSSIYMFPTDGGRCHCLDPTFTGLQSLSLWTFRINWVEFAPKVLSRLVMNNILILRHQLLQASIESHSSFFFFLVF